MLKRHLTGSAFQGQNSATDNEDNTQHEYVLMQSSLATESAPSVSVAVSVALQPPKSFVCCDDAALRSARCPF